MEYLYYAPFCDVFSSGDNLHRDLATVLMIDQDFVRRVELKSDLGFLSTWWDQLTPEQQSDHQNTSCPPIVETSPTYKVWEKRMLPGYRERAGKGSSLTPEESSKLLKKFQETIKNRTQSDEAPISSDDADFIIQQHYVYAEGPCICGSSKKFIECCGKKAFGTQSNQK